jgi:arabinose-5-phosphate isomerase
VALDTGVQEEACPLNLAPTASTTATLAMGDALAVALLESRGFTREDFALSHPGGSLGRRLLLHVGDLMQTGEQLPQVHEDAPLSDGLMEMTRKNLGMTAVVNGSGQVAGIFTDGDLRRALDGKLDLQSTPMREVMTEGCRTARPEELAAEALLALEQNKITALLVVDAEQQLVGALHVHDLLRAGVV